jgi:hypothetical protein
MSTETIKKATMSKLKHYFTLQFHLYKREGG